jgi:hypothetical protein
VARFAVGIVQYQHAACFEEVGHALADALRALGHEVVSPADLHPGRLLMIGCNNVVDVAGTMPADAICFNTEQVAAVADPHKQINIEQYKHRIIWDYSRANIAKLRELGCTRVVHCPIGYMPGMTNAIASGMVGGPIVKDIDVLFYGSENDRRRQIFAGLSKAGLKVVRLFNVYGEERDKYIAASKVVLNMHYYPGGVFEIFRVSHLLANKVCVVSEAGGCDQELEDFAASVGMHVPYDFLVDACADLVAYQDEREKLAQKGYDRFVQTSLIENVKKALEASPSTMPEETGQ